MIGNYRGKLQEFLVSTGPRRVLLQEEISSLLKRINKEDLFKAKVEQRKNFEKSSGAFFRMIRESKRQTHFDQVTIEGGNILTDINSMKNYFVKKYSELFTAKQANYDNFKQFDKFIPKIGNKEQVDGIITLEEVKKVVF